MPIHSAQPDVAIRATPASRMPHPPEAPPRRRNNSQGAMVNVMAVPTPNAAMISAPCTADADKAATIKAEYNKPHGIKAQAVPKAHGARGPKRCRAGLKRRHKPCDKPSTQAGWRASHTRLMPKSKAAT